MKAELVMKESAMPSKHEVILTLSVGEYMEIVEAIERLSLLEPWKFYKAYATPRHLRKFADMVNNRIMEDSKKR